MWPLVNGVALADKSRCVFMLGSDGSQQEGDNAEAARLAVAQDLNVKIFIDDNDVTIAYAAHSFSADSELRHYLCHSGHPSDYLKGYDVGKTLQGHGLKTLYCQGEDIDDLYATVCEAVTTQGPVAVVIKRKMAPGIEGS